MALSTTREQRRPARRLSLDPLGAFGRDLLNLFELEGTLLPPARSCASAAGAQAAALTQRACRSRGHCGLSSCIAGARTHTSGCQVASCGLCASLDAGVLCRQGRLLQAQGERMAAVRSAHICAGCR